jgi:hypothetical protein
MDNPLGAECDESETSPTPVSEVLFKTRMRLLKRD